MNYLSLTVTVFHVTFNRQLHVEHSLTCNLLTKSYPKTHLNNTKRDRPYTLCRHTYVILKTTYNEINTKHIDMRSSYRR